MVQWDHDPRSLGSQLPFLQLRALAWYTYPLRRSFVLCHCQHFARAHISAYRDFCAAFTYWGILWDLDSTPCDGTERTAVVCLLSIHRHAGWNGNGLAWFVGLISSNLGFLGSDGPCHLAEEVRNASTVVPWAMLSAVLLNGALGLAISIAFSFTLGDLETDLTSATGYDSIQVFFGATNSRGRSSAMTAILIALVTCALFGFLASASRQTWAFARDNGLPFSGFLSRVDQRTALPLRSISFCAIVSAIIGLINIGSTVAFNAIVSLSIAGIFVSYLIVIVLMVLKRVKRETPELGPWSLGWAGLPVNLFAACSLLISVVFSFFPPATPVTPKTMNWSCLMWGGSTIVGLVYYALLGRKIYHGPVVEKAIVLTEKPRV